jgi:hypothetical protein
VTAVQVTHTRAAPGAEEDSVTDRGRPGNWWIDVSATTPPETRLINNIAVQFGHLPAETAAGEVAGHVRKFWDRG